MTTILRCLCALALLSLAGCTSGDLHEECKTHQDCPTGQVCSFEVCVDEGSVQGQVCREGRAYCDGSCVDTVATLETCGGCDGCRAVEHATALACNQGSCVYVCEDGWRDTDNNTANGCECAPDVDCDCRPTGDEVCDGLDNDCDGGTDNVPAPVDGAIWVRNCGTRPNASPANCGVGGCVFACTPGFFDRNADMNDGCECESSAEVCDGEDNDCNGIVDDGDPAILCPSPEGADGACAGRACIYQCQVGHVDIDGDLRAGPDGTGCECAPSGEEVCDGLDNDCDGLVDAEDEDLVTELCEEQRGVCQGARAGCFEGEELACGPDAYARGADERSSRWAPIDASCDRVDNDCDGIVDENCCQYDPGLPIWGAVEDGTAWSLDAVQSGPTELAVATSAATGIWFSRVDLSNGDVSERINLAPRAGRVGAVHTGRQTVIVSVGEMLESWAVAGDAIVAVGSHDLPEAALIWDHPLAADAFPDGSAAIGFGTEDGFVVGLLAAELDAAEFISIRRERVSRVVDVVTVDAAAYFLVEEEQDEGMTGRLLFRFPRDGNGLAREPASLDLGSDASAPVHSLGALEDQTGATSTLSSDESGIYVHLRVVSGNLWEVVTVATDLTVRQRSRPANPGGAGQSQGHAVTVGGVNYVLADWLRADDATSPLRPGLPDASARRIVAFAGWLMIAGLACRGDCTDVVPLAFGVSLSLNQLCVAD